MTMQRWFCGCGIVRDLPTGPPPICRHNVQDVPVKRMRPIHASHPYATGPLPWSASDPSAKA